MAVIVMAENSKLTEEMYDGMVAGLREVMASAPGFVAHVGWSSSRRSWHRAARQA